MSKIISIKEPTRKPDLEVPSNGARFAFKYWEAEDIISFYNTIYDKWQTYSLFRATDLVYPVRPKEYINIVAKDKGHPHHESVIAYLERILLE